MRLSEAIVLGSTLVKQIRVRRHSFDQQGACALGAAEMAICAKLQRKWFNPIEPWSDKLAWEVWPWIMATRSICPHCDKEQSVMTVIFHLNDLSHWSFSQIASWVRSVEPRTRHIEDANAVRLPEVSGNELSGERTQNTLNSDRELVHK